MRGRNASVIAIPVALLTFLGTIGWSVGGWAQRAEARLATHDGLVQRVDRLQQVLDDSAGRIRKIEIAVARIEGKQTDNRNRFEEEFAK